MFKQDNLMKITKRVDPKRLGTVMIDGEPAWVKRLRQDIETNEVIILCFLLDAICLLFICYCSYYNLPKRSQ